MNASDDREEIESLLARLSPSLPSEALMAKLKAACPTSKRKVISFRLWLPLSAAALVLAFIWTQGPANKSDQTLVEASRPAPIIPVVQRQHLMEVEDFGVVEDRKSRPVRIILTTWVDEFVYVDGTTGKQMKDTRVRQELSPVAVHTF